MYVTVMNINRKEEMTRTILVHLNVTVPVSSTNGPDEVADMILAAIEVGSDSDDFRAVMGESFFVGDLATGNDAPLVCTLAEEV